MKAFWVGLAVCFLVYPQLFAARNVPSALRVGEAYILRTPGARIVGSDYEAEVVEFRFTASKVEDGVVLVRERQHGKWFHLTPSGDRASGWLAQVLDDARLHLKGTMSCSEFNWRADLVGVPSGNGCWRGTGEMAYGVGASLDKFPFVYRVEWSLCPGSSRDVPKISKKVKYAGPPLPKRFARVAPPPTVTALPASDLTIKSLSYGSARLRESMVKSRPLKVQEYIQALLRELTWEEVRYMPGIILMMDWLADTPQEDRRLTARSDVRDGSSDWFDVTTYEELRRVPPPFVLVKCYSKLSEEQISKLRKASAKLDAILTEAQKLGERAQSAGAIDQVMANVLAEMSAAHRDAYFALSAKLRNYVRESGNSHLRSLFPAKKGE